MGIDLKEEVLLTDNLENIVDNVGANALQAIYQQVTNQHKWTHTKH